MTHQKRQEEIDNKEKYYEHLTYPTQASEGMSPLVNQYTALMPQNQNIYLYGTPGHFGPENQYNSPIHSDNPFIHERIAGYYHRPYYNYIYYNNYNYCPYFAPYYSPYF